MRQISSRWTVMHKRVFPIVWFGMLGVFQVFVVWTVINGAPRNAPWPVALVPAGMMIFGYVLFRRLLFDLVDEVWDDGDELLVRNGGEEVRIPFADIQNVNWIDWCNPPRMTLLLRDPCTLGREITFSPPGRRWPFSRNSLAYELIERANAARGQSQSR